MPSPSTLARGNILLAGIYGLTISPASVAANTTAEQAFTLTGVLVGDVVSVTKPTLQAGLGIVNSRVSAANTIAITYANTTASPIVPTASELYSVELNRPENLTLPTAVT
jgi:hypothetical protein